MASRAAGTSSPEVTVACKAGLRLGRTTLATSVNVGCNFMLGVAVEVGGTIVIVGVFEGEGETRATEVHPETNNVFNTTTQISL